MDLIFASRLQAVRFIFAIRKIFAHYFGVTSDWVRFAHTASPLEKQFTGLFFSAECKNQKKALGMRAENFFESVRVVRVES